MAIQSNYPDIRPSLNLDFANTKTLDPRVTFTRASTATFYDGKTVAKAEENLLLNSATLATQNVAVIAQAYTLSFQNTGSVTLSGASTAGPLVGTGVSNRVSLTFTPTAGTLTLTVSGTVSNAQLEARSSATAYTPTTTQPITNYVPALQTALAGVPRFDHNPLTGESLGLEIEEQRVNLLTYSEQFDNAAWTKSAISITANTVVAPDGTLTADVLIEDTSTGSHQLTRSSNLSFSSGTAYTLTFFAKQNGRSRINIAADVGASTFPAAANAIYDLSTGTIVSTGASATASIVSAGNGWYRCSFTATATATAGSRPGYYIQMTSSGNVSYTGDGFSGIYLWGAQLEAGAFATSYIPTVASQVTRSADAASMTGTNFSSWYRQDEGTAYIEATTSAPNSTFISLCDFGATSINRFTLSSDTSRRINIGDVINNVVFGGANTSNLRSQNVPFKVAGYHSASGNAVCLDASAVATASNTAVAAATVLTIGARLDFGVPLNGTIRRLAYYPKRLTNAQLQAITS
jgi:hypothetical protein